MIGLEILVGCLESAGRRLQTIPAESASEVAEKEFLLGTLKRLRGEADASNLLRAAQQEFQTLGDLNGLMRSRRELAAGGEVDALHTLEECVEFFAGKEGLELEKAQSQLWLAREMTRSGQADRSRAFVEAALATFASQGAVFYEAVARSILAAAALALDEASKARAEADAALEVIDRCCSGRIAEETRLVLAAAIEQSDRSHSARLYQQILDAVPDCLDIRAAALLGLALTSSSESGRSEELFAAAIAAFRAADDIAGEIQAWIEGSRFPPEKRNAAQTAVDLARKGVGAASCFRAEVRLGEVLEEDSSFDEAVLTYRRALECADQAPQDPGLVGYCHERLAAVLEILGEVAAARIELEMANATYREAADDLRFAWTELALGNYELVEGTFERAGRRYGRAEETLARFGEVSGALTAVLGYARVLSATDRIVEAELELKRLLSRSQSAGLTELAGHASMELAALRFQSGNLQEAAAFATTAIESFRHFDSGDLARAFLLLGDVQEASGSRVSRDSYERALEHARESRDPALIDAITARLR